MGYRARPRLSGGAYQPALKKVDSFLEIPLRKAREERERRAEALLTLDDAVKKINTSLDVSVRASISNNHLVLTDISGQTSYTVSTGHCYRFTLTGTDNVGNVATLVRTVMVDTSAPSAPSTLTFGSLSNAIASGRRSSSCSSMRRRSTSSSRSIERCRPTSLN